MTKSKTFVKLETAIPTKSQVEKGLNIVRDQLALDKQREDLKEDRKTLHDIFSNFFDGVPNWVNKVWNSPGNNPMDNTHYDVNMFARAYCGMLATPQYTEMLAFTNGLDDGKDKKTFTIYFTDKKAGKLITIDKEKTKSQWVTFLSTAFTNRKHIICDKEREKKEPTLTREFNAAIKRMLKAMENEKFADEKTAKQRAEIAHRIAGFQDMGFNVTLK
tara:strand:- start:11096 stop:11746 length:651 start_codon:yes stop_codon:yes gene_type:complete